MTVHPTELRLKQETSVLEIDWSDGRRDRLALRYMRGWCPCAVCQGHFVLERRFVDGVDCHLIDVEPVGTYAIRPRWGDGHQVGIYPYVWLREIADGAPGDGPSNAELLGES